MSSKTTPPCAADRLVVLVAVLRRRKWHFMEPSKLKGMRPAVLTQMRVDDGYRIFEVGPHCSVEFRPLRQGRGRNFTGGVKVG